MLPVLILALPPVIGGGSYGCWMLGQQTALSFYSSSNRLNDEEDNKGKKKKLGLMNAHGVPIQATVVVPSRVSTVSYYTAGIVTFGCVYGFHIMFFPTTTTNTNTGKVDKNGEGSNSNKKFIPPHKRALADQFQPPKSLEEVFQRMGRPILVRSVGAGAAFFCAGVVQTYMTLE